MSESADQLEARGRDRIPAEVPVEEVERLLDARFPGRWGRRSGGSHLIILSDPDLRRAEELGPLSGTRAGPLSISLVRGRYVKRWLVHNLLLAIDARRTIQRGREDGLDVAEL